MDPTRDTCHSGEAKDALEFSAILKLFPNQFILL